jgi:hypothetical protein
MLSFAKSNRPGHGKKKNTTTRFTAVISKDEATPKSLEANPNIAAKKLTDFKADVEYELRNVDFKLGVDDDGTPLTDVLIKYHCGMKDKTCVLE